MQAVDGVSFDVMRGETLGLVGESGCGKSTTARLLLRLLDPTVGRDPLRGPGHHHAQGRALKALRRDMQMIFQDPYSSLNPRKTVGTIISEPFAIHGHAHGRGRAQAGGPGADGHRRPNPEHYNRYPHEFSGGQRQRIGVARALALKPKLIVADEPVSALDVSIQAQILNLLRDLQRELGLTLLFIAHDLSVVRHMCDRVAVMYLGKIVELATSDELYAHPRIPYTGALMSAVPVADPRLAAQKKRQVLAGDVPSPTNPPRRAASTPAAGRRRRSAAPRTRRWSPRTAATSPPATSRSPTPRSPSASRRSGPCATRPSGRDHHHSPLSLAGAAESPRRAVCTRVSSRPSSCHSSLLRPLRKSSLPFIDGYARPISRIRATRSARVTTMSATISSSHSAVSPSMQRRTRRSAVLAAVAP